MIFFTTFTLTLFVTQVGRAVAQASHDPISRLQPLILTPVQTNSEYKAVYSNAYDNSSHTQ